MQYILNLKDGFFQENWTETFGANNKEGLIVKNRCVKHQFLPLRYGFVGVATSVRRLEVLRLAREAFQYKDKNEAYQIIKP